MRFVRLTCIGRDADQDLYVNVNVISALRQQEPDEVRIWTQDTRECAEFDVHGTVAEVLAAIAEAEGVTPSIDDTINAATAFRLSAQLLDDVHFASMGHEEKVALETRIVARWLEKVAEGRS